jgi:hypothetical protein
MNGSVPRSTNAGNSGNIAQGKPGGSNRQLSGAENGGSDNRQLSGTP